MTRVIGPLVGSHSLPLPHFLVVVRQEREKLFHKLCAIAAAAAAKVETDLRGPFCHFAQKLKLLKIKRERKEV